MAVNAKANFVFSSLGLAFLAGIGLMIGNIAPTIVTAYVDNPMFSVGNAGSVISINMFGNALGALIISFLLQKINWSRTAFFFFLFLLYQISSQFRLINQFHYFFYDLFMDCQLGRLWELLTPLSLKLAVRSEYKRYHIQCSYYSVEY